MKHATRILVPLILLALSGCKAQDMSPADVKDLLHVLRVDIHAWWMRMQDPVVARVNGRRITTRDLESAFHRYSMGNVGSANNIHDRQRLLDVVIQEKTPALAAEIIGWDMAPEFLQRRSVAQDALLAAYFREQYEASENVTEKQMRDLYDHQLLDWRKRRLFNPAEKGARQTLVQNSRLQPYPPYAVLQAELRRGVLASLWNQKVAELTASYRVTTEPKRLKSCVLPDGKPKEPGHAN